MPRRDVRTVPVEQARLPLEPTANESFEVWYLSRMDWLRIEQELWNRYRRFQQIAGNIVYSGPRMIVDNPAACGVITGIGDDSAT